MTQTVVSDVFELRRRLGAIHAELRSAGLNPVEALGVLAGRLKSGMESPDDELGLRYEVSPAQILSLVFQVFMAEGARNGLGQYLTPEPVGRFVAEIVAAMSIRVAALCLTPSAGRVCFSKRRASCCPPGRPEASS